MGYSSRHDKSERYGGKGTSSNKRISQYSAEELEAVVANLEDLQETLPRQRDEYRRLRDLAQGLQTRLRNSQRTLELLSSTSLVAQQARRLVAMSRVPGQEVIDRASRRAHLELEIECMSKDIEDYNRRADAMAMIIAGTQQHIEDLRRRIYELRAAEANARRYGEQGGPDPGWGRGPGSGGGTGGGGSHGYYGSGRASSSAYYSRYA